MAAHSLIVPLSLAAEHLVVNGTTHAERRRHVQRLPRRPAAARPPRAPKVFLAARAAPAVQPARRALRLDHLPARRSDGWRGLRALGRLVLRRLERCGASRSEPIHRPPRRASVRARACARLPRLREAAARRPHAPACARSAARLLHQHRLLLPLPRHTRPAGARRPRKPEAGAPALRPDRGVRPM
eukprot:4475113-Prymnesium_polylepis.1